MKNKVKLTILTIFILLVLIITGLIVNFLNSNNEYYKNEKDINIPIFVYHSIVDEMTAEDFMQTTKENFTKQIVGLRNIGYNFITYDDLIAYNEGKKKLSEKSIIITLDDGYADNYNVLYPVVKELNVPVTINIIDDRIGQEAYLTWEQIIEMEASGLVSIYSHSAHHNDPNTVPTEQYVDEIKESHKKIEEKLGKQVTKVFTYPYGLNSEEKIEALAKEGFVQNMTDNLVNNSKTLNMYRLHREYPLNDSVAKIILKTFYRRIRYGG